MNIVITGGCKNGKSSLAQDLAIALSGGGRRFYIATMIPADEEDHARIAKHVADRDGMGFETIECGLRITDALSVNNGRGAYLLDSVTALLANEMFAGKEADTNAGGRVLKELLEFADGVENCVYVFDGIFSDAAQYDELTETYRRGLAEIECRLAAVSEVVVEMCAGMPVYLKGSPELLPDQVKKEKGGTAMEVVTGGAYQGKVSYAKAKYGLTDEDIYVCTPDKEPDFSRRCLVHMENYVLYAMRAEADLRTDYDDGTILIFDDTSCGVVPIDKEMRLFREAAARYMTSMAKKASVVTRVTAGLPQILKDETISSKGEN